MGKQDLSIGVVLIHYGAKSLPGGYGWKDIRCPFPEHDDRNASARVNLELGGFICLGCGKSGDAIKIIREREGMTFGEAIEFAREVLGASVETVSQPVSKRRKPNKLGRNKWKDILG